MTVNLVTGGAGFVGKRLVAALRARGERVRSFDLAAPGHPDDVQGSVTDRSAVDAALHGVETVFHLAGDAQLWAADPERFRRINVGGTEVVLAAAHSANVRRFIQCSSLTTLVGKATPVGRSFADESVELAPTEMLGPYPESKRLADVAVVEAVQAGLDAILVLPTEPLGAGDVGLTPPTRMILDLLNGKTPATIDCTLNFVPVDSLAEGFIAARDHGRTGERYLLGGDNVSMKQLLAAIERISGVKMPRTQLPYVVALMAGIVDTRLVARLTRKPPKAPLTGVRLAGRRVSFSSEKAARDLGWRATPFESALTETITWMRETDRLIR